MFGGLGLFPQVYNDAPRVNRFELYTVSEDEPSTAGTSLQPLLQTPTNFAGAQLERDHRLNCKV